MASALELQRTGLEARSGRIDSLDLLRGVAILGIFLMNTQSMGLPEANYINPAMFAAGVQDFFTGKNWWTWVVVHILADVKFITIFSMMFGAGVLLQADRMAARAMSPVAVHYRRMAVLLLLGILHAYLIWYGDILTTYALCGMLLYPLRKLPASLLMFIGILLMATAVLFTWCEHAGVGLWLTHLNDWTNSLYNGLDEVHAYRTGGAAEFHFRAVASFDLQTRVFLEWTFWRCAGAILIGMALQRWRFFHGAWPPGAYAFLALLLIPLGWAVTALGVWFNQTALWDVDLLTFPGTEFNYLGSLLAAVGYMAAGVLVALAVAHGGRFLTSLVAPVRAIGQMALSNYLLQSVVGTAIFYGHGLGQFGKISRVGLLAIVAATWTLQLTASWLWMRCFRQGPVEWLWRKLAYLGRTELRAGGDARPAPAPLPHAAP
ncbi:MAG TPA: DUF418 domain-containing protein [Phycisphaerae bacterium]|nr:DUF418 domain-containing protein [Phycisphaerae bacterium]